MSPFWLDDPRNVNKLYYGLWVVCVLLVAADLLYHKHGDFSWETWLGFHGWFGFVAFAFVVLSGWVTRKILSRPEDYYDR